VPDLARSWEWSEDHRTITFHLHQGVRWHDGQPFTSADVKFTYDTIPPGLTLWEITNGEVISGPTVVASGTVWDNDKTDHDKQDQENIAGKFVLFVPALLFHLAQDRYVGSAQGGFCEEIAHEIGDAECRVERVGGKARTEQKGEH